MAGWALGQAGLKTQTRKGLAALILGANMPDIDVFLGWVPWVPLAIHRGFTHGLVGGVLVMPPLLAGLLLLLDRWQVKRGKAFKSGLPMRAGWLLALCYFGAITHPLLDMLTTYSVQLLSPFSLAWYHADALFIIDLFLWLLLGLSLFWSKLRERRGQEWRRLMQVVIGIVLAYIAGNLLITQFANAAVRLGQPAGARRSSPRRRPSTSGGATSSGAKAIATGAAASTRSAAASARSASARRPTWTIRWCARRSAARPTSSASCAGRSCRRRRSSSGAARRG